MEGLVEADRQAAGEYVDSGALEALFIESAKYVGQPALEEHLRLKSPQHNGYLSGNDALT